MILFVKLFVGLVLFGTLVALTVLKVPDSARLLDLCYAGLIGLGITHLGGPTAGGGTSPSKTAGFVSLPLLCILAATAVFLAACGTMTTQTTQVTYTQSCAAYGAAFDVALHLREAGKLNESQIAQVSLIDSQITPMCTGSLPADPDDALAKITAAVTALTILETVK